MKTTIGIKIGFAFFALLLLFGVIGTNIYYSVNDGMITLEQIKDEARKQIRVGNLRFKVTQVLMASNDYVITNKEIYKQKYQKQNALLDKDFHNFIQSNLTDKEKQLAYEIRIDIDSIRIYSERIFSITNPRQSNYAWELMEIMDYSFGNSINDKTTLIFDGVSVRIEENRTKAEMAKQKIITLVQRAILISLIFSLIIMYFSIVNISRPIKKITKAANLIAKGDYTKRLEIKTHDEIASLADSFNQMSESIHRSQKALEDSKRFVESIIEAEPECVCVISQDGTLQNINPAGLRIIEADISEQVVGKKIDQLIVPEHLQSFLNLSENVYKGVGGTLQFEIVGMKGRRRWLETNSVPLYDDAEHIVGHLGINRDITERKLAEEFLLKFRMGIERSGDAVLLTEPDGTIVYVNPAFENIFGYSKEEAIGKTPRILKSGNLSIEYYKNFWNDILTKKPIIHEIVNKTKDGRLLSFESSVNPIINEQGEIIGFLAIERDITKRKNAEQELIIAKEKAESANKLKDAFIANISHEIRTPLNGILGLTSIIRETYSQNILEEDKQLFVGIKDSSNRIIRTVDMILNYSRLQVGEFPISPKAIDISSICKKLVKEFKVEAEVKAIDLLFENRCKNSTVFADDYSLTQAISNLIDNAIKYTKKGLVKLVLYNEGIDELRFDVQDSGIGITEDYLHKVFTPYIQEDMGYGRAYEGVGLGLAIAKQFLKLNNANISVVSKKGVGTTFTINFGKEIQPKTETIIKEKVNRDVETMAVEKNQVVLLVEDDFINQVTIKRFLRSGYKILTADSSEEAVDILQKNNVDIILMDVSINGAKNGLELTKDLKASKEFSQIPIIVITAHAFENDRKNAFEAGCDEYLSKPFTKELLLDTIAKFV